MGAGHPDEDAGPSGPSTVQLDEYAKQLRIGLIVVEQARRDAQRVHEQRGKVREVARDLTKLVLELDDPKLTKKKISKVLLGMSTALLKGINE